MKYKKILCPIDFSDISKSTLNYAVSMANGHETQLVLVHVIEHLYYHDHFLILSLNPNEINDKFTEIAKENIRKLTDELPSEIDIIPVIREGNPQTEIVNEAKKKDVDLIVIGSHGRTGMSHFILGSVAERVAQLALCPVLIVKPKSE